MAHGCETSAEVQFYRLLTLLTGRTLRHLDSGEFDRLSAICTDIGTLDGRDEWAAGVRVILLLIDGARKADDSAAPDPQRLVKEIENLPARQRDLVVKHLGVLRDGPIEDQMWRLSVEQARAGQQAGDRRDRIWAFFQPVPAGPRARPVRPAAAPPIEKLRAVGGGLMFLLATYEWGALVLRSGDLRAAFAYLAALAGTVVCAVTSSRWHFHVRRVRAGDGQLRAGRRPEEAPAGGFARQVGRLVDKYFQRYVPRDGTDRTWWLEQTAGIRQGIRDELVEIYREERVKADQIAWLVRHLVGDVRRRWEKNELLDHRVHWRTPARVHVVSLASLVTVVAASFWTVPAAVRVAPVWAMLWILLALASAVMAAVGGFRVDEERRRVQADEGEYDNRLRARHEAYERWVRKLSCKPTDAEMAEWLECDRRILVDETMRHYHLRASQVIAHAFIEAPGRSAKRARVHHGPWRYSRYRMLLFLLTDEGVRQVDIDLDFQEGDFQRTQRLNYRFDTVAAVRIEGAQGGRQTFELTLFNGQPVRLTVTEPPDTEELAADEDAHTLSRLALDASGLPRTLNVLEGIAAEGKEWIKRKQSRADERLGALSTTIRGFLI